jgi:hypothetical protein
MRENRQLWRGRKLRSDVKKKTEQTVVLSEKEFYFQGNFAKRTFSIHFIIDRGVIKTAPCIFKYHHHSLFKVKSTDKFLRNALSLKTITQIAKAPDDSKCLCQIFASLPVNSELKRLLFIAQRHMNEQKLYQK